MTGILVQLNEVQGSFEVCQICFTKTSGSLDKSILVYQFLSNRALLKTVAHTEHFVVIDAVF